MRQSEHKGRKVVDEENKGKVEKENEEMMVGTQSVQ